jgi:heptosyltransferase-2
MSGVRGAILAPNWLGDAVMSLPALAALRASTGSQPWTVLARPAVAAIYRMAPLGMEVTPLPAKFHRLPRLGAREVILLPNSFHAALWGLRLGARRRVGYARDGRAWLLHPAIPVPAPGSLPGHESFYYLELLRRAGYIDALPAQRPAPKRIALTPPAGLEGQWRERLGAASAPLVAIHAGSAFGMAKCWLPDRFAAVAGALSAEGAVVMLIGAPGERDLARQVRMLAPHPEQIKNLVGETSLEDLVALLRVADLLIANDSGPMHVAGAVGTPVVALFGPTNEKETFPMADAGQLRIVKAPGIECSPCKLRTCPIDHRCMENIAVTTVLSAARAALETAPGRRRRR